MRSDCTRIRENTNAGTGQGKRDNRGLSLVELILTIAIMAIVGGAILGFFLFSTRQYHRGSAESTLQNEAQMVMERLERLIVNATDGLGTNDAGDVLYVFDREQQKTSDGNGRTVCRRTCVSLEEETRQLVSGVDEYVMDSVSGVLTQTGVGETLAIADYMDTAAGEPVFSVDLSGLETGRKVTVIVRMRLGEQTFAASSTFALRNPAGDSVSDDPGEHFKP